MLRRLALPDEHGGTWWPMFGFLNVSIAAMRRSLFASFGSCSVQEPIDDLVRMQLA